MAYPVSVVQLEIDPADPESNRAAALARCADAIARGARLVALPEACVSDLYKGAAAHAEPIPGPLTEAFARIAGEAAIALPLLERAADGNVYSACAFVTAQGVRGIARKTHLYHDSTGLDLYRDGDDFRAGNELSVFDLGGIRAGVALGLDAEFPEVFRPLALKG